MLHEFMTENRLELAARCREKVARRPSPAPTENAADLGVPILIEQIASMLREQQHGSTISEPAFLAFGVGESATKHGAELLRRGFTVGQVVHDYGDLCQAVTELAHEKHELIGANEFHTFNLCLDVAIANAVVEFGRLRDQVATNADAVNVRLGALANEQRNLLNTVGLAFTAIKGGHGAANGLTGAVLERSLDGLRSLIDRSLADVRLSPGLDAMLEVTNLDHLLSEIQIAAQLSANTRNTAFAVTIEPGLTVTIDRQMFSSALANLLQNAFKFTRAGGGVSLIARRLADRVLIEVRDECGGLPPGQVPFEQRGVDRSGSGLGLSISRRGIEASGGTLAVVDMPGVGCVFTIDLPFSKNVT